MSAIDVGPGTTFAGTRDIASTVLSRVNAANNTGYLTSFQIKCCDQSSGVKMGTFYGSSTSYTMRDFENIGTVTSGSVQTFTGKNCNVSSGDFLGVYGSSGSIYALTSGGGGFYSAAVDNFKAGAQTYTLYDARDIAIYATGDTEAPVEGWTTAKLGGIASASIIKVAGIAVASVKKVAGVAVQ